MLLACLTLAGAGPAVGQNPPAGTAHAADRAVLELPRGDSATLRLSVLYQLAEQRSPQLEAARALARAAEARVPGVKRPPDPQLQLGFMNRSLPSFAPMDPLGMTQLQLMQMVPLGGKLSLSGNVASARADAARERAADVGWDVRSRVAMAFYELYLTDQSVSVAAETRRLLVDIAKTAEAMYAVGNGRQADVLKARVEIAQMEEEIVRMRTMRVALTATIAGLLDREPDSSLGSPVLPAFPAELPSIDSLVALAERNRPMIRAGYSELRAADASAALARKEVWPDLELGVAYGQRGGETGGVEQMASFMLGATLPMFAGSRRRSMREEADAMRLMARADLQAMRSQTRARVTELYAKYNQARNLAQLYRTTVLPQARAAVTSSLAAYRVGDVNLMTLLDNEMTVNHHGQQLFALDAAQGMALAELEMLIGRELFDPSTTAPGDAGSKR